MKKSALKVASKLQSLSLMQLFLFSNMVDNGLEVLDPKTGKPDYAIKLGWFCRDGDGGDKVGCPCFICNFHDTMPSDNGLVSGIVYVKAFASRDILMTKMHFIADEKNFTFEEILDGEEFVMDGGNRYLYKNDVITPLV